MQDREFDYINVIPLVDIMLVLLTIVLTTATFMAKGDIPVSLPEVKHAEASSQNFVLKVSIDKEGRLFLGSKPTDLEALERVLSDRDKNTPVEIWSDAKAKVETLTQVLGLLNRLGFRNVSLAVVRDVG